MGEGGQGFGRKSGLTTMTFDKFLAQAWVDHGDRALEVSQRLEQGYAMIDSPAQLAPFARILAHVDGEHLAQWAEGAARLERLRAHAQWRDDGDGAIVVRRLINALVLCGGGGLAPSLTAEDRAHAHAVAAAALVAQGERTAAIGHFRGTLAAAATGLPQGDPAIRALAITSNNLAAALAEVPLRSAGETAAMLEAAQTTREHWARAGGWLETERAEYMLAKCHLAAGDAKSALVHANECAAICAANDADAFERFFADSMAALAYRALADAPQFVRAKTAALAHYDALTTDQKSSCESALKLIA